MNLSIDAISDMGCVRQNNEDMILVEDEFIRDASARKEIEAGHGISLVAVSDGMGGHNAGELASEFVLRKMAAALSSLQTQGGSGAIREEVERHVQEIHASLNELGKANPEMNGLGCTFTGLLFYGQGLCSIHVGDSRLYRLRGSFITRLTSDHTLSELLKDDSIPKNQLANCFGGNSPDIFCDFADITDRVSPGDLLLICSDGLNGELTDEEIADILHGGLGARGLVDGSRERGARDNVSCVVISVH